MRCESESSGNVSGRPERCSRELESPCGPIPDRRSDRTTDFVAYLDGDDRALGRIFEDLHSSAVQRTRWALKIVQDREDAAQSAFTSAIRSRRTFDRSRGFSGWFAEILRNEALRIVEKAASRRKAHQELSRAPERVTRFVLADSNEDGGPPRGRLSRLPALDETHVPDERLDQVRRAALRLAPKHRKVIELHYFEGCSQSEAADLLGCPIGTFASRMRAAQEALRAAFVRLSETRLGHATEITYFVGDRSSPIVACRSV